MSSAELEEGVLDVTKQVPREALAAANSVSPGAVGSLWSNASSRDNLVANRAAKALSIWRWRDETKTDVEMQRVLDRGGRDRLGTVFYLCRS